MTEREFATDVVRRLRAVGHQALWAGGCVRDMLLGQEPDDFDVATSATPEQVQRLFRSTGELGVEFGVVRVLGPPPIIVEVATFRSDGSYSDGRHPDAVVFSSPEEDARRRDFTVNGMFFDPLEDKVIDYVGGQEDLRNHVLRAIGDPDQRFGEDKLRLLRAVRFATRFSLALDPSTEVAIRAMANQITVVSAERIAEELRKLLTNPRRADGVRLMNDVNLLFPVLPEVATTGAEWAHSLRMLEALPVDASFPLALAALLRDSGRQLAGRICQRLKLSNAERDQVTWLVGMHKSLNEALRMRISALKPILAHPGIRDLLALNRSDAEAGVRSMAHVEFCEQKLRDWSPEELDPPPILTGDDLLALGIKQGPIYKRLLDAVRVDQLDGVVSTREQAVELVRRLSQ